MAVLVFSVLFLSMFGVSEGTWCVCRSDVSSSLQQKALDYACGAGADCSPILQNGACYNPNTVVAHCSFAANSYYQRKGQAQGSCDFAGTAVPTQTDPSSNGCTYPATPSAGAASSSTQNPGSSSSSSSTGSSTASSGGTAGVLGGLGPSGTTATMDGSAAASRPRPLMASALFFPVVLLPALVWLRVL